MRDSPTTPREPRTEPGGGGGRRGGRGWGGADGGIPYGYISILDKGYWMSIFLSLSIYVYTLYMSTEHVYIFIYCLLPVDYCQGLPIIGYCLPATAYVYVFTLVL